MPCRSFGSAEMSSGRSSVSRCSAIDPEPGAASRDGGWDMDKPTNEGIYRWAGDSADDSAGERMAVRETLGQMLSTSPDDLVLDQCQRVFVGNGYRLPEELSPTLQIVMREGRRRRLVPPELDASM